MRNKILLAALLLLLAACRTELVDVRKDVPGGNAENGREAILAYGCGSCHTISGISHTYVGPPLDEFVERHFIAGNLANTAENLVFWIQHPQTVEPGTAMPDLGVSAQDARDIAAYLYNQ
jgi:cytochrome c